MKNIVLPTLLLSVAIMGGVLPEAYAQGTNTDRLIDVVDTTGNTHTVVVIINTILDGISNTITEIISLVSGLEDGLSAVIISQDDIGARMGSLTDVRDNLESNQDQIQSRISDVSAMLDRLEATFLAKISELEMRIGNTKILAERIADLEGAINDLNYFIRYGQNDTEKQISALGQSLEMRLTDLETRLGDVTDVSEQISSATVQTEIPGPHKGTATRTITLFDYSTNVGEFDYNDDVNIDYNLKFECEETIYISDIRATPQGDIADINGDGISDELLFTTYGVSIFPGIHTIHSYQIINPFNETDDSKVTIPDIQLTDIVLLGEYRTIPAVQRPITLKAGDSFTIQTSMDNRVIGTNVNEFHVFQIYPLISDGDTKKLLDSKVKIDKDAVDTPSAHFIDPTGIKFVTSSHSNDDDLKKFVQRLDNQPLYNLAKHVDILKISVEWFGAASDPKCTFTPTDDAILDYPNLDNMLSILAPIENINVSVSVDCNDTSTRIADIGDIRIGGAITNHDVGTLTLTADNQSITLNLNDDDTGTFSLADDDMDFPFEFTNTLQITGIIVPEYSPGSMVIEITYDTAAGNTCTQQ